MSAAIPPGRPAGSSVRENGPQDLAPPELAPSELGPGRLGLAILVCLALGALLSARRIVAIAERQDFGARRDASLALAQGLQDLSAATRLDRPGLWLDAALGRATPIADGTGGAAPSGGSAGRATGPGSPGTPLPQDPVYAVTPLAATTLARTPGTSAAAGAGAAPGAQPSPGIREAAGPGGGTASSTATARAALAPARRDLAPEAPLRVYVGGDSFAQPLAQEIAALGGRSGMAVVDQDGRISTGIARPDYFDWPARLAQVAAGQPPPEAVLLFMGANDDQNMVTPEGVLRLGSPEWRAEYRRRVGEAMDRFAGTGIELFWVGLPIMRDAGEQAVAHAINDALAQEAAPRAWVHFVDIEPRFTDPSGAYTAYMPDAEGAMQRVRQQDGVHLTRYATNQVAAEVYARLGQTWDLTPPTPTPSPTASPTASATPSPSPSEPPTLPPGAGSTPGPPGPPTAARASPRPTRGPARNGATSRD